MSRYLVILGILLSISVSLAAPIAENPFRDVGVKEFQPVSKNFIDSLRVRFASLKNQFAVIASALKSRQVSTSACAVSFESKSAPDSGFSDQGGNVPWKGRTVTTNQGYKSNSLIVKNFGFKSRTGYSVTNATARFAIKRGGTNLDRIYLKELSVVDGKGKEIVKIDPNRYIAADAFYYDFVVPNPKLITPHLDQLGLKLVIENLGSAGAVDVELSEVTFINNYVSEDCDKAEVLALEKKEAPIKETVIAVKTSGGGGGSGSGSGSTSAKTPTNVQDGSEVGPPSWVNVTNGMACDGSYVTTSLPDGNSISKSLRMLAFDFQSFDIPGGSIIKGIEVTITKEVTGGLSEVTDNTVQLLKGLNNPVGNNKAAGGGWLLGGGTTTYGGPTDLWGTTWSFNEIVSNSNFGVRVIAQGNDTNSFDDNAGVDCSTIKIYYQ